MKKTHKVSIRTKAEIRFLKYVGKRILSFAANRKVTVETLAYESEISKGYAYDIVNGKGNPSLIIIHRIANNLGVEPKDIIS